MKRSLADKLFATAAPSIAKLMVEESVPDLDRILALPRRIPFVCERNPLTKKYPPRTQALIEIETAKFARPARISCACRPRRVTLAPNGMLAIFRVLPEGDPPEAPVFTTREAFLADNRTPGDADAAKAVAAMQPGQEIELPPADGADGHPCILELSPQQAWFLREGKLMGGAIGFLGVGSGKSIAFLLAPLLFEDSQLAVLLIDPKQRHHYKSEYLRLREHFRVGSIVSDLEIRGSIVSGTTPVHLISYSVLSRTENSDKLDTLKPDTLLLDEGHRACGESAINLRVKRYGYTCIKQREADMRQGKPVRARALRLMVASGTLEKDSINDTQMLCAYGLGTGSPLPLDPNEAVAYAAVVDVQWQPDTKSSTARALYRAFAGEEPDESNVFERDSQVKRLREGFQKWRAETPGIITAVSDDVNASMEFTEFPTPKLPELILETVRSVRIDWKRPDGQEFLEKVEQLACVKNVSCGFYTYWAFPNHPCTCPKDKTAVWSPNWCDQCTLIENWYDARAKYAKERRTQQRKGEMKIDSEKLCELAAERAEQDESDTPKDVTTYCYTCANLKREKRSWPCVEPGHLPAWRSTRWKAWRDIQDKVEYVEKVRWIGHDTPEANDPATHPGYFLVRHVAEWALKNKAVIWVDSVPLGEKISELSGLPYFNGGPGGEERLRAEKGNRSIICSISAHGAGTNGLQFVFNEQVIVEMPPSNATAQGVEQILGRLHRRGQRKDRVYTRVCLHVQEFKDALRKAIRAAEFNYQMTNNSQKLLMVDMDIDEL